MILRGVPNKKKHTLYIFLLRNLISHCDLLVAQNIDSDILHYRYCLSVHTTQSKAYTQYVCHVFYDMYSCQRYYYALFLLYCVCLLYEKYQCIYTNIVHYITTLLLWGGTRQGDEWWNHTYANNARPKHISDSVSLHGVLICCYLHTAGKWKIFDFSFYNIHYMFV